MWSVAFSPASPGYRGSNWINHIIGDLSCFSPVLPASNEGCLQNICVPQPSHQQVCPVSLLHLPLTHPAPFHHPPGVSLLLFWGHVSFAFFVVLEMASAEAGVICLCPLPKFKFHSMYIANEPSSLSSWINTLITVFLFQAGHQCCSALTSWCVAVPLPFLLSPVLPVHVRSIQPGILQEWGRTVLHKVLGVAKCRWRGVSRECEHRECLCN